MCRSSPSRRGAGPRRGSAAVLPRLAATPPGRRRPGRRGGARLGALLGSLAPAAHAQLTDYEGLTNVYRTVTNFNVETVRGTARAADGTFVFLNTHGSILAFHRPGGVLLEPDDIHPTLNNPIALDIWYSLEHERTYVAVLGGVTHALALHDFDTGRIVASVQLPAETGDVVVDNERNCAFVSCPGDNTVHQIDLEIALTDPLPQSSIIATFTVASQRPRFLSLETGDEGVDDNVVYVTPELSGNNTVTSARLALQLPDAGDAGGPARAALSLRVASRMLVASG